MFFCLSLAPKDSQTLTCLCNLLYSKSNIYCQALRPLFFSQITNFDILTVFTKFIQEHAMSSCLSLLQNPEDSIKCLSLLAQMSLHILALRAPSFKDLFKSSHLSCDVCPISCLKWDIYLRAASGFSQISVQIYPRQPYAFLVFSATKVDRVPDDVCLFSCLKWDKYLRECEGLLAAIRSKVSTRTTCSSISLGYQDLYHRIRCFSLFCSQHKYQRDVSAFSQISVQMLQGEVDIFLFLSATKINTSTGDVCLFFCSRSEERRLCAKAWLSQTSLCQMPWYVSNKTPGQAWPGVDLSLFFLTSKDCFERGIFSSASITKTSGHIPNVCFLFLPRRRERSVRCKPRLVQISPFSISQNLSKTSTMMTSYSSLSFLRLQNFMGLDCMVFPASLTKRHTGLKHVGLFFCPRLDIYHCVADACSSLISCHHPYLNILLKFGLCESMFFFLCSLASKGNDQEPCCSLS